VEEDNTGLRLRVVDQATDLYKVQLLLRASKKEDFGISPKLINFNQVSEFEIVAVPTTFTFQLTNELRSALIEFRGKGGQSDSLLFPPVQHLRETRKEQEIYQSKGYARAYSGGQSGTGIGKLCEPAPKDWHFLPGTGVGVPKAGNIERAAAGFVGPKKRVPGETVSVTPLQACVSVWAYAGDARPGYEQAFEGDLQSKWSV
jgi:hypothetical protein